MLICDWDSGLLHAETQMTKTSNQAAPGNGAMTILFHAGHSRRCVPEEGIGRHCPGATQTVVGPHTGSE
jgi:hypothetical protein